MSVITIGPDHIVAGRSASARTAEWPASIADLCPHFFSWLELDPAVTLGDVFRLVDREDLALLEAVLGERIAPLVEEARHWLEGGDVEPGIEYLYVGNKHTGGTLLREFFGWGPWSEPYQGAWIEAPDTPRVGPIGVSLCPLPGLLGLPLRYDPSLVFWGEPGVEDYRTTISITLIEFLKAIFDDLTFYGTPGERDDARAELDRRLGEA